MLLWALALPYLAPGFAFTQVEMQRRPVDNLPLFFWDVVNFRSSEVGKSCLELFLKIPYDEVQFLYQKDRTYKAKYEVSVVVFDDKNFQVDGKIWENSINLKEFDLTNSRKHYSFTSHSFDVLPGTYRVTVGVMDMETKQTTTQSAQVEARDFSTDAISISDVMIADSIAVDVAGKVTPFPAVNTPRREVGHLYGYFYLYSNRDYGPFKVELSIRNAKRKKVYSDSRKFEREGNATPVVFEIADKNMPHGMYALKIKAKTGKQKAEYQKVFFIRWEGVPVSAAGLEAAIDQMRYIARGKNYKKIKKAEPDSQRQAFRRFWKSLDPSPSTERNELMEEYYRRVEYANAHFSGMQEGWRTDRGMVYIVLGPPDDVERDPMMRTYWENWLTGRPIKAWQVWQYYDLNRYFVFFDEDGFGDFKLANPQAFDDLHTTFRF